MPESSTPLVETIRKHLADSKYSADEFNLSVLAHDLNLSPEILVETFGDEAGLIEKVLEYEEHSLENIFSGSDFSGNNAIDGLLNVSKEISKRFNHIQPSISFDLRKHFPEVRQQFVEKRVKFVLEKIRRNFDNGIHQGFSRQNLSTEMVSRIYISRLLDLHNPDFFPNDDISFNTLFEVMFDTFIRGICNDKGMQYYNEKIKGFSFR